MKEFKPGWYRVSRTLLGVEQCCYFKTTNTYTAECSIELNGGQSNWWDAERSPPARKMVWHEDFKAMPALPSAAHWDEYSCTLSSPETLSPIEIVRLGRTPTDRENALRSSATDFTGSDGSCVQAIHVGVFFDGTNNNMLRDRPTNSHSNIVSLYDAHKDDQETHFAYYLPGVGTAFPEIGELEESSSGKSFATGGEARIHYAMLQVYNAVCTSFHKVNLIPREEMKTLVTEELSSFYRRQINDNQMHRVFQEVNKRLLKAILGKRPRIIKLHLSVFGFSRGAAEARVFCNWIREASGGMIGEAELNLRFLGIFDTVASVGLADSSPVGRGFLDWAHNNLGIGDIDKTVHYLAGHEIRRSFPASTVRDGNRWPKNTTEYVYPGTHSDIGGGYSVGDQGKSLGGRSALLSQITLNDMYEEALTAGVRLKKRQEMDQALTNDFAIDPNLHAAFMAYLGWTREVNEQKENLSGSRIGVVNNRMHTQMQYYWRWRASKKTKAQFKAMHSYQQASEQDKQDLWESEQDWQSDIAQARKAHLPSKRAVIRQRVGMMRAEHAAPTASQTQRDLVLAVDNPASIPPLVDQFFDRYVHDSHAGFWLLGPITQWDKQQFMAEIRRKKAFYDALVAQAETWSMPVEEYVDPSLFALNRFEQKVYDVNGPDPEQKPPTTPNIPVMTDDDASDLRDNAGVTGLVVKYGMGSATRREANGSGQYRRLFDHDHEVIAVLDEVGYLVGKASDAISHKAGEITDGLGKLKDGAVDAAMSLPGKAADAAIEAGKNALKNALPKGLPTLR